MNAEIFVSMYCPLRSIQEDNRRRPLKEGSEDMSLLLFFARDPW